MSEEKREGTDLPLNWEQLNALTAEVIAEEGPGSSGWNAEASHTKRFNEAMIRALRENGGKAPGELGDVDLLILTTTGAKSGKPRTVVVGYHVIDDRLIIVPSMGGADRNPPWFHNLVANPEVIVEKDGETFKARAYVPEGDERDYLYGKVCEGFPVFAEYQERTERVIPVVELQRIED